MKVMNDAGEDGHDAVNFGGGSVGAERETDAAVGDLGVVAGSHQDVAGLDVTGGTGGTGGDGDAGVVKVELDGFTLGSLKTGVQEVRQAMGGGAIDAAIRDFGEDAGAELVTEWADMLLVMLG